MIVEKTGNAPAQLCLQGSAPAFWLPQKTIGGPEGNRTLLVLRDNQLTSLDVSRPKTEVPKGIAPSS
jgi:hypothetical protein